MSVQQIIIISNRYLKGKCSVWIMNEIKSFVNLVECTTEMSTVRIYFYDETGCSEFLLKNCQQQEIQTDQCVKLISIYWTLQWYKVVWHIPARVHWLIWKSKVHRSILYVFTSLSRSVHWFLAWSCQDIKSKFAIVHVVSSCIGEVQWSPW